MIYDSILDLIGCTPLIRLKGFEEKYDIKAKVIAKVEYFNPTGSSKDRISLGMIEDAEKNGMLSPGSVIVEPTSGNTGIGLAMVGKLKGYRVIIVMPDTMSIERIKLIKAYGAEVVLTDGKLGMKGSIDKANEISKEYPNSFIPSQFDNPVNWETNYKTLGPEIFKGTDGKVDIFIASIGTGGTLTGASKYLKEKNPDIKIVGVEPLSSPLLTKGEVGSHKIQGIGANFIPSVLDTGIYDEIIDISNEDSFTYGRELALLDGILGGISSGAVLKAAEIIGKREENIGKNIVILLPDGGLRYLSTELFI